jgi:hypothetical protein
VRELEVLRSRRDAWSCSIIFTVSVTNIPPKIAPLTLPDPPRITIVIASNEIRER